MAKSETIRISSEYWAKENGKDLDKLRYKLIKALQNSGYNVRNGYNKEIITLKNIEKNSIMRSNGFVFMPQPTLQEVFKLASLVVGYQTGDPNLDMKPTVIMNPHNSWDPFLKLLGHMNELGTVRMKQDELFTVIDSLNVNEVVEKLSIRMSNKDNLKKTHAGFTPPEVIPGPEMYKPEFSVCVFCSSSSKNENYLDAARSLGRMIAEKEWGLISGAGSTGLMGAVVSGAVNAGGFAAGANVPHITAIEGKPSGLNTYWSTSDIYTRMEIMIDESQAFAIMPGGAGSVQELMALVLMKNQDNRLMRGKDIVIVNKETDIEGVRFWDPAISLLKEFGYETGKDIHVVNDEFEAIEKFTELRKIQNNLENPPRGLWSSRIERHPDLEIRARAG